MPISIGIDYAPTRWSCCVSDEETIIERTAFGSVDALVRYLAQTCAFYPEAALMIALPLEVEGQPLQRYLLQERTLVVVGDEQLQHFLRTVNEFSQQAYLVPAVQHLPTVPLYRRLLRPTLGASTTFCMLVSLLYFMRQQQADWAEMNFSLLSLQPTSYTLLVIKDGCVVDGTGEYVRCTPGESADGTSIEQAILERLTYDLAGIMAVHQLENVVLLFHAELLATDEQEANPREHGAQIENPEAVIEHFADLYQFFMYPVSDSEMVGFEAAQGAALLAEGLRASGPAAELSHYLLSC
jgi:Predicted butyrate kinase